MNIWYDSWWYTHTHNGHSTYMHLYIHQNNDDNKLFWIYMFVFLDPKRLWMIMKPKAKERERENGFNLLIFNVISIFKNFVVVISRIWIIYIHFNIWKIWLFCGQSATLTKKNNDSNKSFFVFVFLLDMNCVWTFNTIHIKTQSICHIQHIWYRCKSPIRSFSFFIIFEWKKNKT